MKFCSQIGSEQPQELRSVIRLVGKVDNAIMDKRCRAGRVWFIDRSRI
jgi:hypothetical protein